MFVRMHRCDFLGQQMGSPFVLTWQWDPSFTSPVILNYSTSLLLNKGYLNTPADPGAGTWGSLQYEITGQIPSTYTWLIGQGGYQICRPTNSNGWSDQAVFYDHFLIELDIPTEYYIDAKNSIVYYIPFNVTSLQSSKVIASQLTTIFNINNSTNIKISGLNFMHTSNSMMLPHQCNGAGDPSWSLHAAIVIANSTLVEISNNNFLEISGNGVVVHDQCVNISVLNNEFIDVGKSGIVVTGHMYSYNTSTEYNTPINTLIRWNKIVGIGRQDYGSSGIQISMSTSTTVQENLIANGPRALINLNDYLCGNHRIIGNIWLAGVQITGDHGIYSYSFIYISNPTLDSFI